VFDVSPEKVALMLAEPVLKKEAVASPALLMVAIVVSDEFHATELVRFCEGPAVNIPVASNWRFEPMIMLVEPVVDIEIDTSTGGITVSVALLDVIPVRLAVIVVVP
jgi:hypothetical protein